MPRQPLPAFQPDDNVEVTEQQFYNTTTLWPVRADRDFTARQSMTEPLSTEPLTAQTSALPQPLEPQTAQVPVISGPLHNVATTQSLITALQSTIQPATPRNKVVVIPAEKKRAKTAPLPTTKRLSPRVRLIVTLSSLVAVLLITLLSLTPISSAQGNTTLASNVIQWVQQQQTQLNILAHTLPVVNQAPAVTPAPPPATLPQSQYVAIAQQDAIAVGISPVYFVRQINQESGFNPYAVSPAGAEGIAQFEPGTAAGLGIDPFNPIQALNAAAHLMASYANQYGGNYAMALAAYNAGSGTVQYAINTCGAANWMNCLPPETRNYIYVIMGV